MKGLKPISGRPGEHLAPLNFVQLKDELAETHEVSISDTDVISGALYPKVTDSFIAFRNEYGPVSLLNTRIFLEGPSVGEEFEVKIDPFSEQYHKSIVTTYLLSLFLIYRLLLKKVKHFIFELLLSRKL